MEKKFYQLPKLSYGYNELKPYISQEQLTIHHARHHQGYVNGANAILEKLDSAREQGMDLDVKSTLARALFKASRFSIKQA